MSGSVTGELSSRLHPFLKVAPIHCCCFCGQVGSESLGTVVKLSRPVAVTVPRLPLWEPSHIPPGGSSEDHRLKSVLVIYYFPWVRSTGCNLLRVGGYFGKDFFHIFQDDFTFPPTITLQCEVLFLNEYFSSKKTHCICTYIYINDECTSLAPFILSKHLPLTSLIFTDLHRSSQIIASLFSLETSIFQVFFTKPTGILSQGDSQVNFQTNI